jgi:hypothetical protein
MICMTYGDFMSDHYMYFFYLVKLLRASNMSPCVEQSFRLSLVPRHDFFRFWNDIAQRACMTSRYSNIHTQTSLLFYDG